MVEPRLSQAQRRSKLCYSVRVSETNWSSIKHCKHINVTECDLTCDIKDSFANYIIKVRSIFGEFKSLWKESEKISYMFTVDPAPPALNMTRGDNTITIKADLQKPPCFKYLYDVTYRFKIWIKHEKSDEILYNIQMVNTTMTISSVGLKGNLCGAAQTEYNVHKIKYSDFSSPTCQLLGEQAEEYPFWAISFVIVLVVIVLVVVLYFKCRKTSCETKKPDALIFENHKPVLKFSDLIEEMHHKITMVEKIECPSALISISTAHTDVVKDYPLIGFGYTEKHRLQQQLGAKSGDSLGYTLAHGQSLQSYPNSDNSSSSDVSHGEYLIKSGQTVPFILTLDDIKTKRINPETTNNKYNMAKPAEINQLIERQENVPFNTLRIAGANKHIDNSDGESYDQSSSDNEESPKQSSEDLTIYDISENFYCKRQQTDRCTGYEQRGYMAREL
uniref:Fibronectin type-III domain-containing protein n=1 Tax=Leptobrachium leishanense TaxID=445787 RepID=A0A8C5PE49_9ANUR